MTGAVHWIRSELGPVRAIRCWIHAGERVTSADAPDPTLVGSARVAEELRSLDLKGVYEEHFEYVWRTLLRLGMSESSVADGTQNVFLIVRRRLDSYDQERPLRPWLFGIARNVAREERRRNVARRESPEEERAEHDPSIARLEAAQIVHRALKALGETRREVFVLHALDDIPMKEVAEVLGMPLNTAYSHFRRGRDEFRAAAEQLGALS